MKSPSPFLNHAIPRPTRNFTKFVGGPRMMRLPINFRNLVNVLLIYFRSSSHIDISLTSNEFFQSSFEIRFALKWQFYRLSMEIRRNKSKKERKSYPGRIPCLDLFQVSAFVSITFAKESVINLGISSRFVTFQTFLGPFNFPKGELP